MVRADRTLSYYYLLIEVAYGILIATKLGDLEWLWTAQWPSLRIIPHNTVDIW